MEGGALLYTVLKGPSEAAAGDDMSSLEDIYNSKILDLAANIPRSGRLAEPDATATAHSKLCGSTVTIDLKMEGDRVTDYGQTVKACLLGQSSASIMGRHVVGATAAQLKDIARRMRKMLKEGAEAPAEVWPELALLEPVRAYKARHASTMLVFDAVEDAIRQIEAKRGHA
jgi:NifU-like protein involved in Fe-S cluster formation